MFLHRKTKKTWVFVLPPAIFSAFFVMKLGVSWKSNSFLLLESHHPPTLKLFFESELITSQLDHFIPPQKNVISNPPSRWLRNQKMKKKTFMCNKKLSKHLFLKPPFPLKNRAHLFFRTQKNHPKHRDFSPCSKDRGGALRVATSSDGGKSIHFASLLVPEDRRFLDFFVRQLERDIFFLGCGKIVFRIFRLKKCVPREM